MPGRQDTLSLHIATLESDFAQKNARFHAYLEEPGRFERLRSEASRLSSPTGPLNGQLLAVKDIFHVDGMPTRAGSRLPTRTLAGQEASSISKLKAAGMLVVGKAVTTEFAYFGPGPTRNPHNPAHTPGGSSSGSAAAVAAGLANLALGTQTIGSIIRPASFCGVAGFKPSHGRIPADGVIPLSPSFDHVGLLGRSAAAILPAAEVLCTDWAPAQTEERRPVLAIPTGEYLLQADEDMLTCFEAAVAKLQRAGYWVRRLDPFGDLGPITQRHQLVVAAEAAATHAAWFREYSHLYHPKTAELIRSGQTISHKQLASARAEAQGLRHTLGTQMGIHAVDVWITPAALGAAPAGLTNTGDPAMSRPWTQAGMPSLGLAAGKNPVGLPLGVQLVADYGRDEDLLAWGIAIESALVGTE